MMARRLLPWLFLLAAPFLPAAEAPVSADDEAVAVADNAQADAETVAESDPEPADSSRDAPQTAAGDDRFVPSVRISEDLSVSFPTDI